MMMDMDMDTGTGRMRQSSFTKKIDGQWQA